MESLVVLSLNDNQLTGEIPSELGNLENLYGINLSFNQLTGAIPQSFENLLSLQLLVVHNNNLWTSSEIT